MDENDLWVLDDNLAHDWLSPMNETAAFFPYYTDIASESVLVRHTFSYVMSRVYGWFASVDCNGIAQSAREFVLHTSQHLHISTDIETLTKNMDATRIENINSSFCEHPCARYYAAIPFRSIRYDESQHILLVMGECGVLGSAFTVEEKCLVLAPVGDVPRTIRMHIEMFVFAFSRDKGMLAPHMLKYFTWLYSRLFSSLLPYDAATFIAYHVYSTTHSVTAKEFAKGHIDGTFTYTTARLLRVHAHRDRLAACGLVQYARMNRSRRKQICKTHLRQTFRHRHRIFKRKVFTKTTRSGKQF